ncbi:MAG: hypothetical protein HGB01_07350 [Chlorobiaceae bacterium]|nr:hypothetical protein [Chlorobiaceae bacterium]
MKNHLLKMAVCSVVVIAPSLAYSEPSSEARIAQLESSIQNLQQRVAALEAKPVQAEEAPRTTMIKSGNWHDIKNWRQLRRGMIEQDVESLLGSPEKVIVSKYIINWYYNFPMGEIEFNTESRRLEQWREP